MIPYTAMAYDQRSRWDRFTRMLPYSDRTVVLSRYALGWVSLLIGTAAVTLCQGIVSCLPVRTEAAAGLSPALIYTALCVGTILLSINVPLTLRFGSEKARMVSVLITFLVFASVGFLKGLDAGSPAGAAAFPALLLPAALTIDADGVQYTRNFMPQERLILLGGGTIAAGEPADLTAVDTERAGTVDPDRFLSMGRSTPFAGMAVRYYRRVGAAA